MIWAIVQLSTKETQFFCVMKIIDGGVLPEFPIEEFALNCNDITFLEPGFKTVPPQFLKNLFQFLSF